MSKRIIPQGPSELPPLGYKRDEELKERTDDLEQAAEERSDQLEQYAMNPKALQPDRELQNLLEQFNELEITNPDPAYQYCWVQSGFNGLYVKLKAAEGWEVVQGDMEEAMEMKGIGADTTRRIGDVILMRCRKDIYLRILRRRQANADRHIQSIDENFLALGEKYRDLGVIVKTPENMDERTLKIVQRRATAMSKAQKMTNKWMQEGRMPGAVAPGVEK